MHLVLFKPLSKEKQCLENVFAYGRSRTAEVSKSGVILQSVAGEFKALGML